MKIEVGKKYKTRNGKTVFIHCVSAKGFFIGEMMKDGLVCVWFSDGRLNGSVLAFNDWDLVSEAKEKLKVNFHMDMPEDFKGLTADEIETELRKIFTNSRGKIKVWTPNCLRGFICDDIIVSGMTEE